MSKAKLCLLVFIAMLLSVSAFAVDGVVLINQATVMAAGGFPYYLRQPGSYKLSGNLIVTGDANSCTIASSCDAIHILGADNITIDLNGFSIIGPNVPEVGFGIVTLNSGITVMNGHITGFGDGVSLLGSGEIVRGVTVSGATIAVSIASGTISDTDVDQTTFAGTDQSILLGIAISTDGLVLRCRVKRTPTSADLGSEGISIGDGLIRDNDISGYFIGIGPGGSVSVTNNSIHNNGRALLVQSGRTAYGSNTFLKNVFDALAFGSGSVSSMKNNVCSDGSVC
jgi:hypothetical protein